jgi:hypothetical protein
VAVHANIHDFWPHLVQKVGSAYIGEPDDYVVWEGRSKLEGPLTPGASYDIMSRISPGHAKSADVSRPRRLSFDAGISPLISQSPAQKGAQDAPVGPIPKNTGSKAAVEASIPSHMRVTIPYQAESWELSETGVVSCFGVITKEFELL